MEVSLAFLAYSFRRVMNIFGIEEMFKKARRKKKTSTGIGY